MNNIVKFKEWLLKNDLAEDAVDFFENGGLGPVMLKADNDLTSYYILSVEEDAKVYCEAVFKIENQDGEFFVRLNDGSDLDMEEYVLKPITIYEWVKK